MKTVTACIYAGLQGLRGESGDALAPAGAREDGGVVESYTVLDVVRLGSDGKRDAWFSGGLLSKTRVVELVVEEDDGGVVEEGDRELFDGPELVSQCDAGGTSSGALVTRNVTE